jgi:hypothetical protein
MRVMMEAVSTSETSVNLTILRGAISTRLIFILAAVRIFISASQLVYFPVFCRYIFVFWKQAVPNNLQVNLNTARTPDSFTRAAERVFSVCLCLGKTLPTELARNTAVEMALEPCSDQLADFFLCRVVCRDLESLSSISLPSILTGIEFETQETSVWKQYYCFSPQYLSALKY